MILVDSERSIVKLDADKTAGRLERYRRIAAEAVEQSGRARVPKIIGPVSFFELEKQIREYDTALVAWEFETSYTIRDALADNINTDRLLTVIGPEGGFTDSEIEYAGSAGCKTVSLGSRVLRSETAAIAACSIIIYEFECRNKQTGI